MRDVIQIDYSGDWSSFAPKTNILWLIYLLDKMLGADGTLK